MLWRFGFALSLSVWWLAACAAPPPAALPPAAPPAVLFADGFDTVLSGWNRFAGTDELADYVEGRYTVRTTGPAQMVWANPGLLVADAHINVQAELHTEALGGAGVLCRYQREGTRHSFYYLLARSDNTYTLGRVWHDERTLLLGTYRPLVNTQWQAGPNTLELTCRGSYLSAAVNGVPQITITDTVLMQGDVGVLVSAYADFTAAQAFFDNIEVTP